MNTINDKKYKRTTIVRLMKRINKYHFGYKGYTQKEYEKTQLNTEMIKNDIKKSS